jgi:hypothetical protein
MEREYDYNRLYWLLFTASGVLLGLSELPGVAAGRDFAFVGLVAGLVLVALGARGLRSPETAGGPEELDLRFGVVAVAFVLLLLSAVVSLF